ncbi:hypothetical protein CSOJ01_16071 [Colletotrichum sojae]|uniref:Uncharacterized protein n=1 Tax=Colletotrichum sojae TaxID=2175907 RepID=A0A8H6MHF1_9PEZI|nr:hypothetical protein CSOJ01_16071 [Colletotrichum sojae]
MAYYRGANYTGYSRKGRRFYKRRITGSGYRKQTKPKRSWKGTGRSGMNRGLAQRVQALEVVGKYGTPQSVSLDALAPVSFFAEGSRVGENYFEIPVYLLVQFLMLSVNQKEVYLTGFTLEGDIEHNAPAEFMGVCLVNPSGTGSDVQTDFEKRKFILGNGRAFHRLSEHRMDLLAGKAFKEPHRDGSLFGAPLKEDASSRVSSCDISVNGKNGPRSKTGRCAIALTARPAGTSMASSVAKTTVRSYWPVGRTVRLEGDGKVQVLDKEHVLFCGSPQMIIVLDHGYGRSP